jgi:hypothetical protein
MTTYRKRTSSRFYRKIYEQHYGIIPKDEHGRSYEIHHIDGNHFNNDPLNLKAVTIQEHYDIHYAQGDWAACLFIAKQRLGKSPKELSELSRDAQKKLVEEGRHNFVGGRIQTLLNLRRVENGTHQFIGGEIGRIANQKQIDDGTHPFIGDNHPAKIQVSCIYCRKECGYPNFQKWHGDKCKFKI